MTSIGNTFKLNSSLKENLSWKNFLYDQCTVYDQKLDISTIPTESKYYSVPIMSVVSC